MRAPLNRHGYGKITCIISVQNVNDGLLASLRLQNNRSPLAVAGGRTNDSGALETRNFHFVSHDTWILGSYNFALISNAALKKTTSSCLNPFVDWLIDQLWFPVDILNKQTRITIYLVENFQRYKMLLKSRQVVFEIWLWKLSNVAVPIFSPTKIWIRLYVADDGENNERSELRVRGLTLSATILRRTRANRTFWTMGGGRPMWTAAIFLNQVDQRTTGRAAAQRS